MKTSLLLREVQGVIVAASLLAALPETVTAQTSPPILKPPSVDIVTPTNGSMYVAPADVPITANITVGGAWPRFVSFFEGTNRLAFFLLDPLPGFSNGTVVPVSFDWAGVPPGDYSLTVVAADTLGDSGTSAPVNITVTPNPLPVVTIFAPDPIAVEGTNFHFFPPIAVFSNYFTGTNTATFLVHRDGHTNDDLTVFYLIGGTASNGVDYALISNNVTIPAGRTFALVTIVPLGNVDPAVLPLFKTVVLSLIEPAPVANPPPTGSGTPPISSGPSIPQTSSDDSPILPPFPYIIGCPSRAAAIILEDRFLPIPVPRLTADGCFDAAMPGVDGSVFCLQYSTNMVDWTPVCTNMVLKGAIHYVDPDACNINNRCYRAVPLTVMPLSLY